MPIGPDVGVLLVRNAEEAGQFKIEDAGLPEGTNWTDMAAAITSSANIVVQVANGLSHAAGLVRLTEPTRAAMAAGAQPMKVNGVFGGVLLKNGNIAQHVQWLPATGAQALTVLSSLGPAASLFAITLQLSALKTRLEKIDGKVDQILAEMHGKREAELKTDIETVQAAADRIRTDAGLSDDLRSQLRDASRRLRESFHSYCANLADIDLLARRVTRDEAKQILKHDTAARYAIAARFQAQAILSWREQAENRAQAERTLDEAIKEHQKASADLEKHHTRIYHSALRSELLNKASWSKGKPSLIFTQNTGEELFSLARGLEELHPQVTIKASDALLVGPQPDSPEARLAALGLAELVPEDTLVAVAAADKYLLVLSKERFHTPKLDDLKKNGELGEATALTELRYLRIIDPNQKGGNLLLDLHWKNRSDSFVLKPTDDTGKWRTDLASFFDRLAEHAHIPSEELTAPRWLTESTPSDTKQLAATMSEQHGTT